MVQCGTWYGRGMGVELGQPGAEKPGIEQVTEVRRVEKRARDMVRPGKIGC